MDEGFSRRLKDLIGPDSVRSFSRLTGIGSTTLQKYLDGAVPGLDKAARIAAARGVSLEWLATGENPGSAKPAAAAVEGFVPVPRLDVRASAGDGLVTTAPIVEQADFIAFREEWLRRLGVPARYARILICDGDSMDDTISDGDMMLVDSSVREVVSDGVYVLVFNGLLKVKRVQVQRDKLLLKSDNPRYETEIVPMHETPELIIEGRVRWAGGEI